MPIFSYARKTAYEMRISDWSSDVCSSDLSRRARAEIRAHLVLAGARGADPIARRGQAGAGFGVPDRRGRNAAGARADAGRVAGGAVSPSRARRRPGPDRSEEHTSELQSLMRISYAVFCLKKKRERKTMQITEKNTYETQQQRCTKHH